MTVNCSAVFRSSAKKPRARIPTASDCKDVGNYGFSVDRSAYAPVLIDPGAQPFPSCQRFPVHHPSPRQPVDLQAVTRDIRVRIRRVIDELEAIEPQQDPIFASPRDVYITLDMAIHALESSM